MGKIAHGILGPVQGKVGTVVGVYSSELEYIRLRNRNPRISKSEAAVLHRTKFGLVQQVMKELKPFIDEGAKYYPEGVGKLRNELVKHNVTKAITGSTPETLVIDYANFRLSRGRLALPNQATAVSEEAGKLSLTWETSFTGEPYGSESDMISIGLYHPETEEGQVRMHVERRDAGAATLDIPLRYVGSNIEVWLIASSMENNLASNSLFVGSISLT